VRDATTLPATWMAQRSSVRRDSERESFMASARSGKIIAAGARELGSQRDVAVPCSSRRRWHDA